MINIMELIQKEDRRKKTPMVDYVLWKGTLEGMIDVRANQYPTLSICEGCDREGICSQVEVVGLERLYCGVKNKEWRKE